MDDIIYLFIFPSGMKCVTFCVKKYVKDLATNCALQIEQKNQRNYWLDASVLLTFLGMCISSIFYRLQHMCNDTAVEFDHVHVLRIVRFKHTHTHTFFKH